MKKLLLLSGCIVLVLLFQYCNNGEQTLKTEDKLTATGDPSVIKPVPLGNPGIPGFNFPEDSNLVNKWLQTQDSLNITKHGWGLWAGLTMNSGQVYNGEPLHVFETWLTPDDITAAGESMQKDKTLMLEKVPHPARSRLMEPHQFQHDREMKAAMLGSIPTPDSSRILGFVKYDPAAAKFTIDNQLFNTAVMQDMLKAGKTDIPAFPNSSMTLKPVFEIITQASLKSGYFNLKVWNGPPAKLMRYPESAWPGCVYVDPANKSAGKGSVDIGCKGRTAATSYNVNDFIHFSLDDQTVSGLKAMNINASKGDIAILVGMHVTSKEISRWTWQTFWWAPDADNPPFPSSAFIAAARPSQLSAEARHYAMAIAYTFIEPNQPLTGGNNIGTSLYAFNPYLEAAFGPDTFYDTATVITNGKTVINNYGVQTNCMSCHALANYNPNNIASGPGYSANTYIDMMGSRFNGVLKTDFLWSIPGNIPSGTNFTQLMKNKKKK